jgi:hypothetical protein
MIELQDKIWENIITYLPKLSAEQLDSLKQTTTVMLQELDNESVEEIEYI